MTFLPRAFDRSRPLAVAAASALTLLFAAVPLFSADLRLDYKPAAYAIKGATLVTGRGEPIAKGTVVVRDGVIEAVGADDAVKVPYDAETIDGKGLHVYPGFLDLFSTAGQAAGAVKSRTGEGRAPAYADYAYPRTPPDNRYGITPEYDVASALEPTDALAQERRGQGFTDMLAAPAGAIAAGQSALASLSGLPRRESVIKAPVALHIALRNPGGMPFFESQACGDDDLPEAVATLAALQAMARDASPTAAQDPAVPPPSPAPAQTPSPAPSPARPSTPGQTNPAPGTPAPATPTPNLPETGRRRGGAGGTINYPTSLMGIIAHLRQAMLDAEHHQALKLYYEDKGGARPPFDPALDALYAARTRALPVWWEANTRDEIHRALDLAEEFGTTAVIVGGREAWKVADRLKAQNVPVVLRVDLPDEPKVPSKDEYRKKKAEEREEPLAVLEDRKARWAERAANASKLAKAGVTFAFATDGVTRIDTFHAQVRKLIAAGLPADAAVAALTREAAAIVGLSKRLGTIEPGKLGHLVVMTAPYGDEKAKPRYVLADGLKFDLEKDTPAAKGKGFGGRGAGFRKGGGAQEKPAEEETGEEGKASKKAASDPAAKARPKSAEPAQDAKPEAKTADVAAKEKDEPKEKAGEPTPKRLAEAERAKAQAEANEPPKREEDRGPDEPFVDVASELEAHRRPAIHTGGDAFIKGAKVLTVTKGTVAKGNILIVDGKIEAVGPDVEPKADSTVIDGAGLVAMPGIIDTHSHLAVQGGVNEMSLSIVPEVRVKDVVNGDDPAIYRALAGGTTAARLLHGSANTIGGQDAVIKLKHGLAGRDLIIKGGPQGVKFALGENVTRRTGRFPNTRMGVEATIERAFEEGRAYRAAWKAYAASVAEGKVVGPPPRRDLRLEALADILDGKIRIHSHCYRSDEILMLLRVAERYGVRVRSLQHVLEGYKVAAEIAAHGASASTFSDWWAYKIEAYDAIPFNASLMTRAGASVCIKSDDPELVRHLNLETAKTVKYGGMTEEQALAMVTINPARELGLDDRLGSIESGKDADIVLFNGHPLDATSRCELAVIDGEVWFQRKTVDRASPSSDPRGPGDHATLALAPASARAKVLEVAASPNGVYAITGATVHPVTGPEIKEGTVVVAGGKIAAVGGPDTSIPSGAATIDARGLDVWPGMIDAGSPVGLTEIGSLPETQDFSDSAQFQPELRTATAIHPDSELIPVTRANGVLAAFLQPSGGVIAGQGCVAQLDGWVPTEMTLVERAALLVNIPNYISNNPDSPRARFAAQLGGGADGNDRRKERLDAIKDEFKRALDYDKVRSEALAHKAAPPTPDPRCEALAPYAKGERLVLLKADNRVEILDAIKLAKDLKLKAAVTGGSEAWKVADELKAAKVPVLVAGTLQLPGAASDPYDAPYANPARLHAAGVAFALRSGARGPASATSSRNLPYEAATAVAFGLPEAEALKAVTLYPAQILGVADQLGSIEVGKRANLVVTAGHLLQPTTEVKALFVGGKPVTAESRHTRLFDKYAHRLDEVRAGTALLGLDRPRPSAPTTTTPVHTGGEAAGGGSELNPSGTR
jgi:imidazolonepropionase-like amidohydrolase